MREDVGRGGEELKFVSVQHLLGKIDCFLLSRRVLSKKTQIQPTGQKRQHRVSSGQKFPLLRVQ